MHYNGICQGSQCKELIIKKKVYDDVSILPACRANSYEQSP